MQSQPIRARILTQDEGTQARSEAIMPSQTWIQSLRELYPIWVSIALLTGLMFGQAHDRPLGPEISLGPVWAQALMHDGGCYGLTLGCDIGQDDEGIMLSFKRF